MFCSPLHPWHRHPLLWKNRVTIIIFSHPSSPLLSPPLPMPSLFFHVFFFLPWARNYFFSPESSLMRPFSSLYRGSPPWSKSGQLNGVTLHFKLKQVHKKTTQKLVGGSPPLQAVCRRTFPVISAFCVLVLSCFCTCSECCSWVQLSTPDALPTGTLFLD